MPSLRETKKLRVKIFKNKPKVGILLPTFQSDVSLKANRMIQTFFISQAQSEI